jgi:hypothetical protein
LRTLFVALERYRSQQSTSPSSISESVGDTADNNYDEDDGKIVDVEQEYLNVIKARPVIADQVAATEIADCGIEPMAKEGGLPQPIQQKRKKHVNKKNRPSATTTFAQQRCE